MGMRSQVLRFPSFIDAELRPFRLSERHRFNKLASIFSAMSSIKAFSSSFGLRELSDSAKSRCPMLSGSSLA
jgi:hypothetical protein